MSFSNTHTNSKSFTITHARYLASKAAADMHICAQYYGQPGEVQIRNYAEELAQYINNGYLDQYEFGYKRDGERIVCWRYRVDANGALTTDDAPGKLPATADVAGAAYYNFLWQNAQYYLLSDAEQEGFKQSLPITRVTGEPPKDGNGYWTGDKNYHSGGQSLGRQTFRRHE